MYCTSEVLLFLLLEIVLEIVRNFVLTRKRQVKATLC